MLNSNQTIRKQILDLMLRNRKHCDGYQYTVPSTVTYPYQWLWDSCFHAIILSHLNIEDAQKELLSLVSKQFENGIISHIIYWENHHKTTFPKIDWGKKGTSSITQPPLLALAAWLVFQKSNDKNFLKTIYPHLYHFYKYLLTERDPHEKHLVGIMNPDESGEDNSPRFDLPLGLPPTHSLKDNAKRRFKLVEQNIECNFDAPFCMRNFFWVKDVPFNSIMVENLSMLSQIAKELGFNDDSFYFKKEKERIIQAMRKLMFDQGIFYSTFGENYQKIKVKTWAIFAPLFAKIYTKNEARELIYKHLLNPKEFWAKYPIPSVSLDEPSFNAKGFWRGSVWMAINWFVYKGLKNYGFDDIAEKILQISLTLIQKSGFREQFNPLTGGGLGAKNFTWGALVLDMES
ncbi:hypothetical protein HY386_00495 [Candidatus Daviesbacteria bacterium]|nr:hypothetical protein [Candidatus Daviesbacteria bacterium]